MEFRSAYTYDDDEAAKHAFVCDDVSRTKQEFKEESDINVIMKRYIEFGTTPEFNPNGMYGDFSDVGDLLEMQQRVQSAHDAFAALPAKIRDRFGNDPAMLLRFVSDAGNRDEAVKLGLVVAPPEVKQEPAPPAKQAGA